MNPDPKPICERIGQRLYMYRHNACLTLAEVAERTELSKAYIWQLEKGKSEPGAGVIVRLCRVFKVSADELLGIGEN